MQKIKCMVLLATLVYVLTTVLSFGEEATNPVDLPEISSQAAVLIDAQTGQVLFQKNMDQKLYPASTTKIITGMLALEYGELSDLITMSYDAVFSVERDSSHIALDVGEEITLEQALYALSIQSANDAANGIAELIGGSLDNFSNMMNEAAEKAGAINSHFANANGLPDENHYTTAYDMAKITAAALKVPGFMELFSATKYEIPPTNIQPGTRTFYSKNKFVNGEIDYDGILMSKTGWTVAAQHTLVTTAQRGDTTLIAVVMKDPDTNVKWKDTTKLFDYGFDTYVPYTITKEDLRNKMPKVLTQGEDSIIGLEGIEKDLSVLLPAGCTSEDITLDYGTPEVNAVECTAQIPVSVSLGHADSYGVPSVVLSTMLVSKLNLASTAKAVMGQVKPEAKPAAQTEKNGGKGGFLFFVLIAGLLLLFLRMNRRYRKKVRRRAKTLHPH